MPTEFKLPDLGENIESADVLKVLVAEGDAISAEDPVIEVETDKATIEVPCPHGGKIASINVAEGDSINVGDVILTVEGEGGDDEKEEKPKKKEKKKSEPEPEEEPEKEEEPEDEPEDEPEQEDEEEPAEEEPAKPEKPKAPSRSRPSASATKPSASGAPASPSVRKLARELGVDLATVNPGDDGRINREDVIAAVKGSSKAAAPAAKAKSSAPATPAADLPDGSDGSDDYGPTRTAKLPKIRQTIAKKMVESSTTIPHVTNFDDADVTELEKIRKSSKDDYEKQGIKLTPLPFVIKACAQALRNHPVINASLDMDGGQVIYKQYVSIGIAVDTDRGLIVPVIRDVDRMSIPEIAESIMQVASSVRDGSFDLSDLRGGTFTVSNLGAIGGQYSTPIINSPEVAILLPGRSRMVAVPKEDGVHPRLMMPLSLSYDHRLVDGGAAARFLNDVKSYLENPGRLLLAP